MTSIDTINVHPSGFNLDFRIDRLGDAHLPSPMQHPGFVGEDEHVLFHNELGAIQAYLDRGATPPSFEMAGPRAQLFFDPANVTMGIVTCGGLCPGLNDVIRAIVLSGYYHYGVANILGFRYGYQGLNPAFGHEPMVLTPANVDTIGELGGTILGSSRGPQDPAVMVDYLETVGVNILFTIGGDGTLRGAQAIAQEVANRGRSIAVIGLPKTIDNDISFIHQSFGFQTATEAAHHAIAAANTEATGAPNGIGLVKLMGRESGFIAAHTALVDSMVNFCLVPEVPFSLDAFLPALAERLRLRHHAVIALAEGAGQELLATAAQRDKSGNVKLGDIGLFLKAEILDYFAAVGLEVNLKYIDPSYLIRSVPANAFDSAFCLLLGHHAVHAGMSGRTNMLVGYWGNEFTHVPLAAAASARKRINPAGRLWNSVLASTGQPHEMI